MFEGLWFILAVVTALLYGGHAVYLKALLDDVDKMLVTWTLFAFAFPIYGIVLAIQGLPDIGSSFPLALGVSLGVNLVAWPLFVRSIQLSDISLVMPLVALTPAFILGVEYVLLGDVPSATGAAGIGAIIVGTYVLNIRDGLSSLTQPIRSLFEEPGSRYMLIVAVIWSISATVEKIAITSSSPSFYLMSFAGLFALFFLPVALRMVDEPVRQFRIHWLLLIGSAVLIAVMSLAQMTAIEQTPLVNYVIAIKRAGLLVSVAAGILFFGEKHVLFRSLGAAVMLLGVGLIRIA